MKKTSIVDFMARKLAPFMFLFGFYLLSYGHISPGGGFQGGVVMASGVILLALSRGVGSVEGLFPLARLSALEAVAYLLLLAAGIAGIVVGAGFLGSLFGSETALSVPRVGFILLLNTLIGLKVAAGVSIICVRLLGGGVMAWYLICVLFLVGIWGLVAKANLIKKVMALSITNSSIVLLFVYHGSREGTTAPITGTTEAMVDPLPQALMLTAIVVGICVVALALVIVYRLYQTHNTLDMRSVEAKTWRLHD